MVSRGGKESAQGAVRVRGRERHVQVHTQTFSEWAEQGLVGQAGELHCRQAGEAWLQDQAGGFPKAQAEAWVALSQPLRLLS